MYTVRFREVSGLSSFKNFKNQTTDCGDIAYCLVGYFILSHPVAEITQVIHGYLITALFHRTLKIFYQCRPTIAIAIAIIMSVSCTARKTLGL